LLSFAKLICSVPPEAIKHLKDLADAENLLEAAFGKGFGDEQSYFTSRLQK
jgi:hypothetical protein